MAKHDQRILKFLAQNSDRAPTITDMMTRLNISISEISASLSSLLAQGLIAKKTNNQGIECWFPAGSGAVPAESRVLEPRVASDSRFIGSVADKPMSQEPAPYSAPYSSHAAVSEMPSPGLPPQPPSMPHQPAPMTGHSKGGVGLFTLLVGVAIAVAISAFLSRALVEKSVTHLSRGFVDAKTLNEALTTMSVATKQGQSQVRALEDQVKKLSDEVAAMKSADSLKAASAKPDDKKPVVQAPQAVEAAAATPVKRRRRH